MTSTNAFTAFELMHEFDTPIMSNEDLYTFGNVGEVMSEALTPLSASILVPSFESGLLVNFPIVIESKFFNQLFGISHNRISMAIFSLFFRSIKKEIVMENRVHGLSVFGHEFITDEIHKIGLHRFGIVSRYTEWLFLLNVMKCAWTGQSTIKKLDEFMNNFIGSYNLNRLDKFSTQLDLYNDISEKIDKNFAYLQAMHGRTSMLTSVYQIIAFSALAEGKNEITADMLADITSLLSSCKNAESAEIPTALEELTKSIRKCDKGKIQEFCSIEADHGVEWLKQNSFDSYELFQKFIEKNAHRGFQEVILLNFL